jgi:hypothetical protein
MYKDSIDTSAENREKISVKLEQVTFNSIREVMPDNIICKICKDIGYNYRDRMITPIVIALHMIISAIWPEESFNAGWQVLWSTLVSWFPSLNGKSPSRGTVSNARARLPFEFWKRLFKFISEQAQALSKQYDRWRGHRVVLLDGTCISMPGNLELFEEFGRPTGFHGKHKYPLARLVTLCIANTMTVLDYALGRYDQGENYLAHPILKKLRKGDLLLADRHFAAAHFYFYYKSWGLEFLTRAHQCLKISRIKRIKSYSRNDFIGWLRINKNYREKDPKLPDKIMVRFIRTVVRVRGKRKVVWLVTSLLDAKLYPAKEIVELYGRRWRTETLFREVKINLSADILRSKTPEGIRKEITARLVAIDIVRTIMLEAAIENGVEPTRISFTHAVRAIVSFAPALASEPLWKLMKIYEAMLTEIASHIVPVRPGRNEPRMVTRERKHYPKLKVTRDQWRKRYAA